MPLWEHFAGACMLLMMFIEQRMNDATLTSGQLKHRVSPEAKHFWKASPLLGIAKYMRDLFRNKPLSKSQGLQRQIGRTLLAFKDFFRQFGILNQQGRNLKKNTNKESKDQNQQQREIPNILAYYLKQTT